MKFLRTISPYIVIIGIIVFVVMLISSFIQPDEINYTDYLNELTAQNIETIELEGNVATIKLKDNSSINKDLKDEKYIVKILSQDAFEETIKQQVDAGNPVVYKAVIKQVPFLLRLVPYILIILLLVFVFYMLKLTDS